MQYVAREISVCESPAGRRDDAGMVVLHAECNVGRACVWCGARVHLEMYPDYVIGIRVWMWQLAVSQMWRVCVRVCV